MKTQSLILCARSSHAADAGLVTRQAEYLALPQNLLSRSADLGPAGELLVFDTDPASALATAEAAPFRASGQWSACTILAPAPPPPAPACFSETEVPAVRTVAMPADLNPGGGIFGGWLLSQMDQAAGIAAWARAKGRCASVALNMTFDAPVAVGDDVSFYSRIQSVGRTSMQVEVDAWARPRIEPKVRLAGRALFTYVALDADGRPRPLEGSGSNS